MCKQHDHVIGKAYDHDTNKLVQGDIEQEIKTPTESVSYSRRKLLQSTATLGAGIALTGALPTLASASAMAGSRVNVKSKGYAAIDTSGKLHPWEFERRPVGDDDVLIEIKYASICHSDIHQMKGHWGPQKYPQVPGHEIVGVVTAVGKKVSKFKVGDRAGVGCMVDSNSDCESFQQGEEQYCPDTVFTYGYPQESSPTGISQGGYSNNIVVKEHFAVHIPSHISFQDAAPLLCAGITTYSPLMKFNLGKGDKVGVVGIGGLGHLAIKIAVAKGADVYAFTTSPSKVNDILEFGAKEAVVVDDVSKLANYRGKLDYVICTIPYQYDVAAYASVVKPHGTYTQVGMPEKFELNISAIGLSISRVNFNVSLIGGMRETQEVVNFCADNKVFPNVQIIKAEDISRAWEDVVNKRARYRYVIDASTF
ncbi:NAD(P)-dependent alcohol dehydrogenase [Pleionea litopenaei]|uniref:NAD(P)-dependent alcohol dehydrogenase n=1 Tax=Pleionea litopenaei TaxID=3070815 RepID=A0AA51RUZ2_9GAMM|nr:NAD(P)-dependent alcohol dehydrogenase [Pleionea sp. HL-JVS1]WMS88077.1 NAD(P)-dependent alcohol dehydrogenase [Pleionea sp. HL-JVS1]